MLAGTVSGNESMNDRQERAAAGILLSVDGVKWCWQNRGFDGRSVRSPSSLGPLANAVKGVAKPWKPRRPRHQATDGRPITASSRASGMPSGHSKPKKQSPWSPKLPGRQSMFLDNVPR